MGKVSVLGLGPSLSLFNPGGITIGVNDIWSRVKTDYVVCLDETDRFTPERLKVIEECRPVKFYSQVEDYFNRPDIQKIELQPYFPNYECQINIPQLPKSLCSPFVACAIAYKFHQATEIHVYGVDLLNHPHLDSRSCEKIKTHFINLKVALNMNGCELIIYGEGILKNLS
jgi:hypothetical protein